jgi:hypothetical protein
MIGRYHDQQLRLLLRQVRGGFEQLDAGELDAFGLDEFIHRYKRSAQKLWSFCGSSASGWQRAALTLEWWRQEDGEETDWWEVRRHSGSLWARVPPRCRGGLTVRGGF